MHVVALISLIWINRHSFASPRAQAGAGQAPMATCLLCSCLSIPSTQTAMFRMRSQHGDFVLNINFCSSSCAGWHPCKEI